MIAWARKASGRCRTCGARRRKHPELCDAHSALKHVTELCEAEYQRGLRNGRHEAAKGMRELALNHMGSLSRRAVIKEAERWML